MDILAAIKSFVIEYFWLPITNESVYYNPFNTALYAILFALGAAYAGLPVIRRLDIRLDRNFFKSIAPYVFLGGALRGLKDLNIVNTILLETPFIYILMFGYTAGALYASKKLMDRDYWKPFFWLGAVPLGIALVLYGLKIDVSGAFALMVALMIFGVITGLLFLGVKYFDLPVYGFTIPVAAHYWDASTSYVTITNGAAEKHVLGQAFINMFGPEGMFLMKTLIIIPAVYYINREIEGEEKNYYLFLVALLGLALGTRNILSFVAY